MDDGNTDTIKIPDVATRVDVGNADTINVPNTNEVDCPHVADPFESPKDADVSESSAEHTGSLNASSDPLAPFVNEARKSNCNEKYDDVQPTAAPHASNVKGTNIPTPSSNSFSVLSEKYDDVDKENLPHK